MCHDIKLSHKPTQGICGKQGRDTERTEVRRGQTLVFVVVDVSVCGHSLSRTPVPHRHAPPNTLHTDSCPCV